MLTAWGENLLPNGDDYINDTRAHDRQIAIFGDATLLHHREPWKLERRGRATPGPTSTTAT